MGVSYNKCILAGNLVRDPELKYVGNGNTAVCEVSLAVNKKEKKNGEWVESVSYFDVVFFGRTAEVLGEYGRKGTPILVDGELRQDTWQQDGQKRSKVKIAGFSMQLLGSRYEGSESASRPAGGQRPEAAGSRGNSDMDGEVPF